MLFIFPIIMAILTETHYTGRVSIVANTVSMFAAVAPFWDQTRSWLNVGGFALFHAYLLLGLGFGTIAFVSYLSDASMDSDFYFASWCLFNSVIAALVCFVCAVVL